MLAPNPAADAAGDVSARRPPAKHVGRPEPGHAKGVITLVGGEDSAVRVEEQQLIRRRVSDREVRHDREIVRAAAGGDDPAEPVHDCEPRWPVKTAARTTTDDESLSVRTRFNLARRGRRWSGHGRGRRAASHWFNRASVHPSCPPLARRPAGWWTHEVPAVALVEHIQDLADNHVADGPGISERLLEDGRRTDYPCRCTDRRLCIGTEGCDQQKRSDRQREAADSHGAVPPRGSSAPVERQGLRGMRLLYARQPSGEISTFTWFTV